MFEFGAEGRQSRYIEDIVPVNTGPAFNARDERVRHQSIGYLDMRYAQLRHASSGGTALDIVTPAPRTQSFRHYTRIPPLSSLLSENDASMLAHAGEGFSAFVASVGASVAAAAISMGRTVRALPWMPKKYSVHRGVYNNTNTWTLRQARWSLPLLILSTGVLVASLPWSGPTPTPGTPGRHPAANSVVQARLIKNHSTALAGTTNNTSNTTPCNGALGTGTTATSTGPYIPGQGTVPVPMTATSTPLVGGMGGGSTTPTTGSTPITTTPVPTPTTDPTPVPVPTTNTVTDPVVQILNDPLAPVTTVTTPLL